MTKIRNALTNRTKSPDQLRKELQYGSSKDLRRRRGIIAFSLLGMTAMAGVSILQNGLLHHLPDPPIGDFDSDKVNSSDTAYRANLPDGAVSIASLAANIPLAAYGGENRVHQFPWIPIGLAVKAVGEALTASWYFYQMPVKEKAWCSYCIVGAISNIAIASLSLAEAKKAMQLLSRFC